MELRIPAKVLEMKAGTFENDKGQSISFSNAFVQIDGREYKVKSEVDLKREEGKDVELLMQLKPGTNQVPTLVIVELA